MAKTMTIEEIKAQTLSTGATSKSTVYKAKRQTLLFFKSGSVKTVKKGDLAIISGCGAQSGWADGYLIGEIWLAGINDDWEHYANPIGPRVD